jgi:hypothetical protein
VAQESLDALGQGQKRPQLHACAACIATVRVDARAKRPR